VPSLQDLFTQTVGPVSRIQLSYDKNGKSTGVAHIDLKRAGDAQVAFTQYNARLVDGSESGITRTVDVVASCDWSDTPRSCLL
jgi:hypothetical protein